MQVGTGDRRGDRHFEPACGFEHDQRGHEGMKASNQVGKTVRITRNREPRRGELPVRCAAPRSRRTVRPCPARPIAGSTLPAVPQTKR